MDPYIEACELWGDFHGHLIEAIYQRVADVLPDHYLARTDERNYIVLVGVDSKDSHAFYPDVSVTTLPARKKSSKKGGGAAVAEPARGSEPMVLRAFIEDQFRERFIEIYEATPEQRLVTSIEILSPSNKCPNTPGWDLFQRKRQAQMIQGVNLVEIDLLRGGQRMPMLDPWPESPYTLMVARAKHVQSCLVWPASFREPLPAIPVPLARPDPDVILELQPLIDVIYQRARYSRSIDYARPLKPRLTAEDAAWLKQQLRGRPATS